MSTSLGKVPQTELSNILMKLGSDTHLGSYCTFINSAIDKFMSEYDEDYRSKYEEETRMKIMSFVSMDDTRVIKLAKAIHFGELFNITMIDGVVIDSFVCYLDDSDVEDPLGQLLCEMEDEMHKMYNNELCPNHRKRILPFWPITDVYHGRDRNDICNRWNDDSDDDYHEYSLNCDETITKDFIKKEVFNVDSKFDISSLREDITISGRSVLDFF